MADYPTLTAPVYRLVGESEMKTIKNESEANYIITRSRSTKRRRTFTVTYPLMLLTELQTLRTFFEGTAYGSAVIFNWTDPIESVAYEVRFKEDTLKWTYFCSGWVSNVTLILEEV